MRSKQATNHPFKKYRTSSKYSSTTNRSIGCKSCKENKNKGTNRLEGNREVKKVNRLKKSTFHSILKIAKKETCSMLINTAQEITSRSTTKIDCRDEELH